MVVAELKPSSTPSDLTKLISMVLDDVGKRLRSSPPDRPTKDCKGNPEEPASRNMARRYPLFRPTDPEIMVSNHCSVLLSTADADSRVQTLLRNDDSLWVLKLQPAREETRAVRFGSYLRTASAYLRRAIVHYVRRLNSLAAFGILPATALDEIRSFMWPFWKVHLVRAGVCHNAVFVVVPSRLHRAF